jgi:hypothetical protein
VRNAVAEILCVKTLIEILHAVGVETCSGTYTSVYGVANSVANAEVYNEVAETAGDTVAENLCVEPLILILPSVGVVSGSGTNGSVYCIANSVVYGKDDDKIIETAVGLAQVLSVNSLVVIP